MVPELIAYAKSNPGRITVASSGIGSIPHMYWELFRGMTGVDMLHVPYRGAALALNDLLGRQVQVMFASMSSSIEYVRAGPLFALAVTVTTRADISLFYSDRRPFFAQLPGEHLTGHRGSPEYTRPEIVDQSQYQRRPR